MLRDVERDRFPQACIRQVRFPVLGCIDTVDTTAPQALRVVSLAMDTTAPQALRAVSADFVPFLDIVAVLSHSLWAYRLDIEPVRRAAPQALRAVPSECGFRLRNGSVVPHEMWSQDAAGDAPCQLFKVYRSAVQLLDQCDDPV